MDDEGRGCGLYTDPAGNSFTIAARGAFTGDDVLVRIERVFKAHKLKVGKALRFFNRGKFHAERVCPHKGPCPACPLHGAVPALELEIKRSRIIKALSDAGLTYQVEQVIRHKNPLGYRQKVKLMAQVVGGKLNLGVFIPYTHRFLNAQGCPYAHPAINEALEALLYILNDRCEPKDLLAIKSVIVRLGKKGPSAIVVATQDLAPAIFSALEYCVTEDILHSVLERVQSNDTNSLMAGVVKRQLGEALIEPLEGGPLVDPDSFCQSDPEQAVTMYDLVAKYLTTDGINGVFVDAYAGGGGFSGALMRQGCNNIIAVEQSPTALVTLKQLGVTIMLTSMTQALTDLTSQGPFMGIVVDPPKKGLKEDGIGIAQLQAQRVALISCDPSAMAKDLMVFVNHGYHVDRIIPIDFFGGTPEIETVVLLHKQ